MPPQRISPGIENRRVLEEELTPEGYIRKLILVTEGGVEKEYEVIEAPPRV